MCGIFGTFSFDRSLVDDSTLVEMSNQLKHRGPDAQGFHSDGYSAVGNCRLSIIDLSESSNQPIYSDDKKISIVQNGEIYNYVELREVLKSCGHKFLTTGDTEVILRAYEEWGESFIKKLNGMFAIAIMDQRDNSLLIYRDRLGVKPLYMHGDLNFGRLWFASEIKAILKTGIKAEVNFDAMAQFLALNYVPSPHTIFNGITQLKPGHMMKISKKGMKQIQYWDLSKVSVEKELSYKDSKKMILDLLDDATRIRMRSDAPYGAFLSGGIDSSSVVGFMNNHKKDEIKTYSMGFSDPRFDETKFAEMASSRFKTIHTSKIMEYDAASMWPIFIWHTDQPHGDISFIPTYMVSALAVKETKMVLTGDGGDELFAGYTKYVDFFKNKSLDRSVEGWESYFSEFSGLFTRKNARRFFKGTLRELFLKTDPYRALSDKINEVPHQDSINKLLYAETSVLLPGNNLVKPDRMAMANSLEVRSPYLDYRLAELAFSIPGDYKLKDNTTKFILKDALIPMLGDELIHRKKQMFTVPVGEWFKTSLKRYCEKVLFDGRLDSRGIINIKELENAFENHCLGKENYTREIRALIALEIWFRIFIDDGMQDLDSLGTLI